MSRNEDDEAWDTESYTDHYTGESLIHSVELIERKLARIPVEAAYDATPFEDILANEEDAAQETLP